LDSAANSDDARSEAGEPAAAATAAPPPRSGVPSTEGPGDAAGAAAEAAAAPGAYTSHEASPHDVACMRAAWMRRMVDWSLR
jgi:hypothetical protein